MRRTLLIARREFLAYARTVGFWLSLLSLPLLALLGGFAGAMMDREGPAREIAIVDLTGPAVAPARAPGELLAESLDRAHARNVARALRRAAATEAGPAEADAVRAVAETEGPTAGLEALRTAAPTAARGFSAPEPPVRIVGTPPALAAAEDVETAEALVRDLLSGEPAGRPDAVVLLVAEDGTTAARVWSARATDRNVESAVRDALAEANRTNGLLAAGLDPDAVRALDAQRPQVSVYSPASASGAEVGLRDRLPGVVGFILGMVLWSAIITGASILLNSVMEEKASRVLEVLLASASPTEVLAGKVLGVAALTLTVMLVWAGFAGAGVSFLASAMPTVARDIGGALGGLAEGALFLWLVAYFIGGYLMFAVVFAAIGAFCETPREAQTLIGPIMMLLIVPIFVMQMAVRNPDLAAVKVLSWVPVFTPFLMSARAPSHPPLWELAGTLGVMALFAALMIWVAGRAFRAGALSTAKLDWRGVLGALRRGG